jgi:hypothetical protein
MPFHRGNLKRSAVGVHKIVPRALRRSLPRGGQRRSRHQRNTLAADSSPVPAIGAFFDGASGWPEDGCDRQSRSRLCRRDVAGLGGSRPAAESRGREWPGRAQLLLFLDDLMPSEFGKPLLTRSAADNRQIAW